MNKIAQVLADSDQRMGEGGFLVLRRMKLRNQRQDGSFSKPYSCDFVERPMGTDAVVIAIYHRAQEGIQVLVRDGLRPPLIFARQEGPKPIADKGPYLLFREAPAGVIEAGDQGQAGVRSRAAAEVLEEAGYVVEPDSVEFLGSGFFPTSWHHGREGVGHGGGSR